MNSECNPETEATIKQFDEPKGAMSDLKVTGRILPISESTRKRNPHIYGKAPCLIGDSPLETRPTAKRLSQEDRLNKTEREFLQRLRAGVYGTMEDIGIQSITLQIAFDTRYTPDFWSIQAGGDFRFWEVKGGFIREDSIVKLRTAARMFPWWTFVLSQKKGGQWNEEIVCQ